MPTIYDADQLAAAAHAGQVDKAGNAYVEHVRAVAELLQPHGEHAVMAGLLHDVVEDTDVTLDDLRVAGYPDDVVSAVDSVTKRDGETYMDMVRRAAADPLGRLVKLADNTHNSRPDRLAVLDDDTREWLTAKYARARAVLEACPDGPHRPPQGPNEDLSMCTTCWRPTYALRPEGETYGDHIADCSLPVRHEGYCQPGGGGHPRAANVRGYWPHRCGDTNPHRPHEWYDPVFRRDCPGVKVAP